MHTPDLNIDTEALLQDMLDPQFTLLNICSRNAITLDQLIAFIRAPVFQRILEASRLLSDARAYLIAHDAAPAALKALADTMQTDPEHRTVNETIRKSSTKILSLTKQAKPPSAAQDSGGVSEHQRAIDVHAETHTQDCTADPPAFSAQSPPTNTESPLPAIKYRIPTGSTVWAQTHTPVNAIAVAAGDTHGFCPNSQPNPP